MTAKPPSSKPPSSTPILGRLAAPALVLLASGCSLFGGAEPVPACPRVAIASGADRTDVFLPGRAGDLASRVYGASLGDVQGGCAYDPSGVTLRYTVDLFVQRGPAATAGPVAVAYRAGVVDPDGRLIDVRTVRAEVAPGTAAGTVFRQALTQRVPGATAETGGGYRVLIGFPSADDGRP